MEDSVNTEQMLQAAFTGALSVELDRAALRGTGTAPEPRGIINTRGIGSVSMGTNGAQLTATTAYQKIVDTLYELWVDNVPNASALVMHPRTTASLVKLAASDDQPLMPPPVVSAIPQFRITGLSITETQGTSGAVCSSIAGDFGEDSHAAKD